ncbi:MAG: hypothetical protein ACJ76N_12885 [Thermoanaerobaculia bacterium]
MAATLEELKPYKSLILGEFAGKKRLDGLVNDVLKEIESLLHLDEAGSAVLFRKKKRRVNAAESGELTASFLHYLEERTASWAMDPSIKDQLNHLVLVCARGHHVAILVTDQALKQPILRGFKGDAAAKGLAALQQIPAEILNAAFVKGRARTLWLTGTHRRTLVKADNKVLSGIDLEYALDPLDDQTFYFSAARCMPEIGPGPARPVGVVPRSSRVWAGVSKSWDECRAGITALLTHLEGTHDGKNAPLPWLAIPATSAARLDGAFDVSLQPPESLDPIAGASPEEVADLEELAYGVRFDEITPKGADVSAKAFLHQDLLGTVEIAVKVTGPDHVTCQVEGEPDPAGSESAREDHKRLLDLCRQRSWLKVRYESGHTLSDGALYEMRHRDLPFRDFAWVDFTGFDFWEEKPFVERYNAQKKRKIKTFAPDQIGKQRSLFCWAQRLWPNLDGAAGAPGGWLACDDGAMEIADFIHLDLKSPKGRPMLTLIHVKGAGSESQERGISISDYEVVTGQAVKNLRSLDRMILEEGLQGGLKKKIKDLVWLDRKPSGRKEMLKALEGIKSNYDRRVVILQPSLSKTAHDKARQSSAGGNPARLRQLDTLLCSARASCNALSADFLVVADGSPAPPARRGRASA